MISRIPSLAAIALASTLGLGSALAQTGFNATLSFPTGDFSDAEAMTGFGAGLEHNSDLGGPAGWVSGISFLYNPLDIPDGEDAEGGNYITIPTLTGVRFTGGTGPAKFYLQGQIGLVLFIVTDLEIGSGFGSATLDTDPNIHLGFGGGVGAIFNDRVNVGMRFFRTPEMEMTGTASSGSDSVDLKGELTVSMIHLNVGLLF